MKGWELIKKISEGEIKEGTRFRIVGGEFDEFYATYEDEKIVVSIFGAEKELPTCDLMNNFLIEQEEINIQDIEEFKSIYTMNSVEFQIQDKLNELIKAIKQLDKKMEE